MLPYSYGGSGELFFSKEQLDQIMAGMRLKKSVNTRLIEGGRYNVNLRWNGNPTVELHEQTIDTWYMLAGGATVSAEQLLEKAWDEHVDPFTGAVRLTILKLRRKLGEPGLVETVTGVGYRIP